MEIEMSTCETLQYKQMENVNAKLQSGNVNVEMWNIKMQRNGNVMEL